VGEGIVPTPHEKILVIRGLTCNLAALNRQIDQLSALARNQDAGGIRALLNQIVPDYSITGEPNFKTGAEGERPKVVPFPKSSSVA
ncbi:MAG: hypothetical protein WAK57_04205, partial [Desulfobacterales bacterium]